MLYRTWGLLPAVVCVFLCAAPAQAGPPIGSALATGQHPRLFFKAADIPAIRARINELYRAEFQELLDLLIDPTTRLNVSQVKANWAAVNYAFVAALDPVELQALGFRLPTGYTTAAALCAASMSNAALLLPRIAQGTSSGHDTLSAGYPDPLHLPAILAYDWCYPHLPQASRAQIVDAFVTLFNAEIAGRRYETIAFGSNSFLANNQTSIVIHKVLGILAFYGDSYPAAAKQNEMYDAFQAIWLERMFFELSQLYGGSTAWHEGPIYFAEGYLNLGVAVKMFSPAVGTDYFSSTPFFREAPWWSQAIIAPHSLERGCGGANNRCLPYLQRFGDGGDVHLSCKALGFMAGGLRTGAAREASLAKHLYKNVSTGCDNPFGSAGGVWSNGVLFWFLMGDKDVTAALPDGVWAPKERFGLGQYSFLNNTTSQVAFFAQPFQMYGHGSQTEGHFTIHKYGELILKPGNSKGGDARISGTGGNLFHNSIGIHKGAPDKSFQHNGSDLDPTFNAYGLKMVRTGYLKGELLARSFNYVFFDGTKAWGPKTASASHREFVYLKGPENSEYVITFDRVRTIDPAIQTKVWKAWVPTQPRFVNGVVNSTRSTKWTSNNANTLEVTNAQPFLQTKFFESPPTHGRLFLRALSPSDAVISVLGGPDGEYQSADDDGTIVGGNHEPMTAAMHAYLGWGRIEIRPGARRTYDTFLTVMQFGDSNTLQQMSALTKVDSGDMTGVHVRDPQNEWVVLFAQTEDRVFLVDTVSYTFQPAAARSSHLLADLIPNRTYFLTRQTGGAGTSVLLALNNRAGAVSVVSSSDGVVNFELNGLDIIVPTPPAPPRNLRFTP